MSRGRIDSIDPNNILPEGSRRVRRPVGERLIDQYIREESELFLDGVPDDEIEKAVIDSVSGDDSCNSDESDGPDEEEEDPDYVQDDEESEEEDDDEEDDDDDEEDDDEEAEEDDINLEDEGSESEDDDLDSDDSHESPKRAKTTPIQ